MLLLSGNISMNFYILYLYIMISGHKWNNKIFHYFQSQSTKVKLLSVFLYVSGKPWLRLIRYPEGGGLIFRPPSPNVEVSLSKMLNTELLLVVKLVSRMACLPMPADCTCTFGVYKCSSIDSNLTVTDAPPKHHKFPKASMWLKSSTKVK